MKSIESIYKIGAGPSSSHTMGPENAALTLKKMYSNIASVKCELYSSLALTGIGHLTDKIIIDTLYPIPCEIIFDFKKVYKEHENAMCFFVTLQTGEEFKWTIFSTGGGDITILELNQKSNITDIYQIDKFKDFKKANKTNDELLKNIYITEPTLKMHLKKVMDVMIESVELGITTSGIIPGKLNLKRSAKEIFEAANNDENMLLSSFSQAVSEQNASGGHIVTAPTCGACGIIPSIIYYYKKYKNMDDNKLIDGLAIAGLLGTLVRHNASISGAEAGCQAEIGTATSMAAGMIAFINDEELEYIEKAAIVGMEHQLGLTCDPILGYVQVPCIQRNAIGVNKALSAYKLAITNNNPPLIDFDEMTLVMFETGKDLRSEYRETSKGGMAKAYEKRNND